MNASPTSPDTSQSRDASLSPLVAPLSDAAAEIALTLPESTSFEDWRELGERLSRRHEGIGFLLGDWWAFGEHRYGRRSRAVAKGCFGHALQTLKNAGRVAKALTTYRRRYDVSFTHHAEIAALPPEIGDALLTLAATERLSVRALRKLVRAELEGDPDPAAPPHSPAPASQPADPREELIERLRLLVRDYVAAHGRRLVIEAMDRVRREVEHQSLPEPGPVH